MLKSVDKPRHRRGKGNGREFRRVYCLADTMEEAGARLACRTPGGYQLRAIHLINPGQVPEKLEQVLEPWELEVLEQEMDLPGRTLRGACP